MTTRIVLLTLLVPLLAAAGVQDLSEIRAAAESAIGVNGTGISVTAEPPDRRLRLAPCGQPLSSNLATPIRNGRASVRVACQGQIPWSVLVTVRLETEAEVVVARRSLPVGTVLGEDEMKIIRRRLPGTIDCCATDIAAMAGQRVRRPIAAEAVITLDSIEAPPLVRRGEIVTVVADAAGFEVRSVGTALADAREGDAVRIRHSTSLRIIQARADSRGVVRVDR
ncbi:MAG: flagellar basal body P-ring formation chaperone FlgA [Proteobacteria bacterium]|jgi:flagella basal body P-ring formation protein FlgA|nr:flagellar basal body P-ring formation chaperone FlgA [Pseudomonadota bacterium]